MRNQEVGLGELSEEGVGNLGFVFSLSLSIVFLGSVMFATGSAGAGVLSLGAASGRRCLGGLTPLAELAEDETGDE